MPEPSAGDWAEAVRRVRAYYPEDVFPWPSESMEGKAARMARLTCDNVDREAQRIMRDRLDADGCPYCGALHRHCEHAAHDGYHPKDSAPHG